MPELMGVGTDGGLGSPRWGGVADPSLIFSYLILSYEYPENTMFLIYVIFLRNSVVKF